MMTRPSLEERVAALEQQMTDLKALIANGARGQDWRSTVGMFTGDEVMKRIDEAALRYREADRRKARHRQKPKRRTKA
jgi:hypothetical protein